MQATVCGCGWRKPLLDSSAVGRLVAPPLRGEKIGSDLQRTIILHREGEAWAPKLYN